MLKIKHTKYARGGALLTALFIMTLVAIVATAINTRVQFDIYRSTLILTHDKMVSASQALTFWSLQELSKPQHTFTQMNAQGMIAQYPKSMATLIPGIQITGGLYDLQGRYNLNNLIDKKEMPAYVALLNTLLLKATNDEKIGLLFYLRDWILPYDIAKGKDAYFSYYTSQNPPYFPANQPLKSVSELRLIRGYTPAIVTALEPYVVALPEPTPININTASQKVLMSLGPGLNVSQANDLMTARGTKGIKRIGILGALLKKLNVPEEQLTTESHYFLSIAHVKSGDDLMNMSTWFKRTRDKNGNVTIRLIRVMEQSMAS